MYKSSEKKNKQDIIIKKKDTEKKDSHLATFLNQLLAIVSLIIFVVMEWHRILKISERSGRENSLKETGERFFISIDGKTDIETKIIRH